MSDDEYDEDHLHIRGENTVFVWSLLPEPGSPPHTWRKQARITFQTVRVGITSTYVEKTKSKVKHSVKIEDHLHIRGEN